MGKVLVVDDEQTIRAFLKIHFENRGHTVLQVEDGKQALGVAQSESPDLIVSDMNMPVMTGWDAARELKKQGAVTAHIPVIALTAQNTSEDHAEAHEAGCDAFVEKPIDPDRLFDTVGRYLK